MKFDVTDSDTLNIILKYIDSSEKANFASSVSHNFWGAYFLWLSQMVLDPHK